MTMMPSALLPIEDQMILAIRAGRDMVDLWRDCPVHFTREIERRITETLSRIRNGEVCRMADDQTLEIMLDAICDALDDICFGYGDLMRSRSTEEYPFVDPVSEALRRIGAALQDFLRTRQAVIDQIIADREIAAVMRERGQSISGTCF